NRHDAFAEQTIAGAVAAVVIAGRQFDGNERHAQLLVDADLAPRSSVARVIGGIVQPRVVAEFARFGNGVEDPEALAGVHVERADVAFHISFAGGDAAGFVSGA